MTTRFYDISVATCIQVVTAVDDFMTKSLRYCQENGLDSEEIVETRFRENMRPFRYQVFSVGLHSLTAMRALESGEFLRPESYPEHTNYAELHQSIKEQLETLNNYTPDLVNSWADRRVTLKIPGSSVPFTAVNFILSFSHPNLFFHASNAYNIFRMKGVPLHKRDFIGPFRLKKSLN